jgi:predicted XRE-type DNA-binding protein
MKKSGHSEVKFEVFEDPFEALEFSPEEAANLRARSELMSQIEAIIKQQAWTQAEAARRCGVSQPRINELMRGRISKFSLDALVRIATALGRKVRIEIEAA